MDDIVAVPPFDAQFPGLLGAIVLALAIGGLVSVSRLSRSTKTLLYAGLAARVVGAIVRYTILFAVYDGRGDSFEYFNLSYSYTERFWAGDFSPFVDQTLWRGSTWWGTQFVHFPTSIVLSVLGPSMLGAFVVFSLLAFAGLRAFVSAFRSAHPWARSHGYARWLYLFPSLWFWPSSIGKEAMMLFGFGLVTAGYVGRRERPRWLLLVLGLATVFAIRPQVAAVLVLACVLAEWLGVGGKWTLGRAVQAVLMVGLGLAAIRYSLGTAGVDAMDLESVQSYMESDHARDLGGGSAVEVPTVGAAGIPLALINVFLRPFPWEAGGTMPFISSAEIWGFWALVFMQRRRVWRVLRQWRSSRLLRFALPACLIYSAALGMMMSNMGIIARQRVFIFPFLFLLFEAVPRPKRVRRRPPVAPDPVDEEPIETAPPALPLPAAGTRPLTFT
jgi:hypothetical protein